MNRIQMRVGAVIVTYNSADCLDGLLDSLPAAVDDLDVRVVVVDNGSTDDTVARARSRGGCVVIESDNLGYAAGINRGARELEHDRLLLVLNPDVRLHPHSVRVLVDRAGAGAESPDRPGIIAPRVLTPEGDLQLSLRREPTIGRTLGLSWTGLPALSEYVTRPQDYASAGRVEWALGAVLLVTAECRAAVGEWDESFFLYSEETDYCLRARDAGFATWYEPGAVAVHIGGGSGQSNETHAMQIVNRVRLYGRRHPPPMTLLFLLATLARELVWVPRSGRRGLAAAGALLAPRLRPARLRCGPGLIPR